MSGHHPGHDNARMRWNSEIKGRHVMCLLEPSLKTELLTKNGKPNAKGLFEITEQHPCDQARILRKNDCMPNIEFKNIKRRTNEDKQLGQKNVTKQNENNKEEKRVNNKNERSNEKSEVDMMEGTLCGKLMMQRLNQ